VHNLQGALDTWNEKLAEILSLLTTSPTEFKGGGIWDAIAAIHGAVQAIGLALLVLFFLTGVIKTCGSFAEVKKPEMAVKLFVRFALAKAAITYGLEFMLAFLDIVQGIISTILATAGFTGMGDTVLPPGMVEAIESVGFVDSIPLWAVTILGGLAVTVLSFIMILSVYGRFFRLYMYAAIAPVPLAAFAGEPSQSIGKSFVKSYAAVCLEGAVIVCLVAFVATSAFGIFFAGENMGDENPSLREVVAEINQEYANEIARTEDENPHDDLIVTGTRAPWQEVLALYAVQTTTNSDDPLDAITLDARRQQMLREVFWDMNAIEARTEDREVTEIIAVEQEDGTITEETETNTRRTLYITQSARSASEVAALYGFSAEQRGLLAELLLPAYASTWQAVLYGIHSGAGDIVEVAASQIGNAGGAPYWSWYGFSGRVEWCACFVSWCANETGYLDGGRIPRFSYCPSGIAWFQDAEQWRERGYTPQPGDIIFFDWGGDGTSDHVGIVESSDGTTIYTIEGNNGDAVRRASYNINSSVVMGFGIPGYQ
jgi:cell wall-associated NlpC family hydrolase